MPLFGAHFSIAGGLFNAAETARKLECETFQLFTKNASRWQAKALQDEEIRAFQKAVKTAKSRYPTAHDSYLINLAAPGDDLFQQSIDAFVDELERAEALGLSYLVTHPGAHVGSGEAVGLNRIIEGLNLATSRCSGFRVSILLETTAGQGSSLGWRFEHLATILENVRDSERFGVCLDTCHVFAAGYDLRSPAGYEEMFDQFHEQIGLKKLKLFHLNDSVKSCSSRVDRHAGLGRGQIGKELFQRLVNDRRFAKTPMILETPKEGPEGEAMDPVNLALLRSWVGGKTE